MAEVSRTRRIAARPDQVWAALSDFGAIVQWAPMVDHSCLMSDQVEGVGTVRRIQTGRTTIVERVTEWSPGEALAYRLEGLPPVIRSATNRWTIEPAPDEVGDDGGVAATVSITTDIDAGPRPPQQLVARAAGNRLASASDKMLDGLERHLTTLETSV